MNEKEYIQSQINEWLIENPNQVNVFYMAKLLADPNCSQCFGLGAYIDNVLVDTDNYGHPFYQEWLELCELHGVHRLWEVVKYYSPERYVPGPDDGDEIPF